MIMTDTYFDYTQPEPTIATLKKAIYLLQVY